ncbi:MAG: DoxX family membrane protein [Thermoanaerobaculia bacterium]
MNHRLESSFWALRLGLGLTAFLAGLDKFFNLLTDWTQYVPHFVPDVLGISPAAMMSVAGIIEMAAGIALLAGITRLGGYVVAGWLLSIALTLIIGGEFLDVAVRDVIMAIGAFTLARLSEVRAEAVAENRELAEVARHAA